MPISWFDRSILALTVVLTAVILIGPVVFMPAVVYELFELGVLPATEESAGATVGIGVILRAALRRVLQSGVRNVMQTTMGTFARATARAITRRIVRIATKSALLLFRGTPPVEVEEADKTNRSALGSLVAITFGSIVLATSFWAILWMLTASRQVEVLAVDSTSPPPQPVSLVLLAVLGAVPIWLYAGISYLGARWSGATLTFQTGIDSVLMQAYFTGSGSFLPLCTDSDYQGTPRQCALAAMFGLAGMLLLSLGLFLVYLAIGGPIPLFVSRMILLYAFIFSFPILPLDGAHLWRLNKFFWLICWLIILVAFMLHIPEGFNAIL